MTHWDRLEGTGGISGVSLSSQWRVDSKIQKKADFRVFMFWHCFDQIQGCCRGTHSIIRDIQGYPRGEAVKNKILIYLITYISKFNLMTHSHLICIYIAYIIYLLIQNHNKDVRKVRKLVWTAFLIWMGTEYSVFNHSSTRVCLWGLKVQIFYYNV